MANYWITRKEIRKLEQRILVSTTKEGWIDFFKDVALYELDQVCRNAPRQWVVDPDILIPAED